MTNIQLIDRTFGVFLAGLAGLMLALIGCAPAAQPAAPTANAVVTRAYVEYRIGAQTVREFGLSDGTRCVMYPGYTVTCEWRQPVVLVPKVE